MNRKWIRAVFAGMVLAGAMDLAIIARSAQGGDASASKPAEQVYKNIQVLKGTPSDQIIPTMQFVSNALGVECEFCHVQGALEKDDKKPKQTARKMIEMQFAINKNHFEGERTVTCYSCHRGAHDPVGTPIIPDEEPKRAEAPKPPDANAAPAITAEQIIDKYIQAVGGADALQKVTTRSEKGVIDFGRGKAPIDILAKAPNKRISTMHTPNGDVITAYDGHAGWLGNPGGRPPRDMNASENEAASFDANFYLPLEIKKAFTQLRVRPSDKIDGRDVIQVIGTKQGQPPVRFFFDQQSGLLVRTVRYTDTPLGRNPAEVNYADYRDEGGVKIPFRWTIARPLGRFTIQVDQVQQNVPIDDSRFAKPAAPAPASPK